MKKLIVAAFMVVSISTFAQEQNGRPNRGEMEQLSPEQRTEKQLKKLTSDLGLNEQQQKQMSAILAEQNQKRDAFRAERKDRKAEDVKPTDAQRGEMIDKMKKGRAEVTEKIKSILTPEQFEKFNKMKDEKREEMRGKMQERRGEKKEKTKLDESK